MASIPKVALLVETSNTYARGLLQGIISYIHEHRPWSIYLAEQARGQPLPGWVNRWRGDGVIARIENESIAATVRRLRAPAVDLSAARLLPALPWVETDDEAIARMGAQHLLERGFRHFAFVGDNHFAWSRRREAAFLGLVREAGFDCAVHHLSTVAPEQQESSLRRMSAWLAKLPKPVGILAAYDPLGKQVLDACRHLGVRAPDDAAVIGVDNDEVFCALAEPPMTSIVLDAHGTGYAAAALLDRMMAGETVAGEAHLFPPLAVAARRSTDVLAMDDADLARAVRYIREHACEGIRVEDVLRVTGLSRRVFESRFARVVGRTPHAEILRVQLNQVKTLLRESGLTLEAIAERTGFAHAEYLSAVFRKREGMPPSRYRALY
ncbi:MAG: DNA-binding transcriptional regulator, partial [Bryobacterales bacterium]|nr:DNA-binding transcriptional regulator [Bryobacterales bacterium]